MTKLEQKAIENVDKILKDEIFYFNDTACVVLSDAEQCYIQGLVDIDKACEWLIDHVYEYLKDVSHFNGTWDIDTSKMIQDFRKAIQQ